MHLIHNSCRAAVLALCVASYPSGEALADRVLFDFEPAYLYEPGSTVKDHDMVFDGESWHVFYIRGIEGVPGTTSEVQLGHAVTRDLRNWGVRTPALIAGPQPFDTLRVWAPDVRQEGQGWSMYYTGVDASLLQRTGEATSPDLLAWTKSIDNPVVEPDSTVYLWSPYLDVPQLSAFRDPFQFEHEGQRHLLHTALVPDSTLTAGRRGVVHHLLEDGIGGWTDIGPLAVNNNIAMGPWRELESVQLIEEGGRWHLFFTYFGIGGVYWVSNPDLETEWDISSAVLVDPGVGAEITPTGTGDWLITRHGAAEHGTGHPDAGQIYFVLRADTLRFHPHPDPPEVVKENTFWNRWPEHQGISFVASPTFADNPSERGEDPMNLLGNGYLSSLELYEGPFGTYNMPGASAGVEATGWIASEWFAVAPDDSVITLMVAGPDDPDCAVRLVERLSAEGEPLATAVLDSSTGPGLSTFGLRIWDVRPWRGRTVRLEVSDYSLTGWIALDHVQVSSSNPPHTASPPAPARKTGRMLPNSPNPFNPRTEIRFELARSAHCELALYDLRGRAVRRIDAGPRPAGRHSIVLEAAGLASGTYFVRLHADGTAVDQRKISLVR